MMRKVFNCGNALAAKQRIEISFPLPNPRGIAYALIPTCIVSAVMIFQHRNIWFIVISKFPIGAIAYAFLAQ